MKEVTCSQIFNAVRDALQEINTSLDPEVLDALKYNLSLETNPLAIDVLQTLIMNAELALSKQKPLCQDTGLVLVFIEIGQQVMITGGELQHTIDEAVKIAYRENYFRNSVVIDPLFNRINTGTNTPALIYLDMVPGDQFKITLAAKGGGAENMSSLRMLSPSAGKKGITDFVLETIIHADGKPCPPTIVGIGIGGNFEQCAILSKKALLRPLSEHHPSPDWAHLEFELLTAINATGIGPQGLGGKTTALAVHIATMPCHIASLPIAVNLQCHSHRHKTIIL
ncbi:MAG TPA: fumarate hydratase [Candidatus Cloacimonadota bacterium]|nr:fumarate hydratase [Candidatus Cloacimonadota bacterium]HPT71025.1 fumarate hydratase [Candidatus Cloacimonadota bacterium]